LIPTGADLRGMLLERMPKHARCAEIGVWKGALSRRIVDITKPRALHLVDPWRYRPDFPQRLYGGKEAHAQEDMDQIFRQVLERFKSVESVQLHRKTSREFFQACREQLDWVYIDGDHSAEAVLEDLEFCWKRVKEGGIIAGDDYYWRDSDGSLSVRRAVDRFCGNHGCKMDLIGGQFLITR
jgi:hypothetical protein